MKKALALLLVALMSMTLIFANGGSETTAASDGPVEIELWYGAAITEAGPIPDDWIGYDILLNEHNIDLHLSVLPSNESDQDVRIQAAAAGNSLPDIFMVSRPVLTRLVDQGLVAPVDDYYALMPNRTAQQYDADSIAMSTIDGHSYGFASPGSVATTPTATAPTSSPTPPSRAIPEPGSSRSSAPSVSTVCGASRRRTSA